VSLKYSLFSVPLATGLFWRLATRSIAAQHAEPQAKPISPSRTNAQDARAKPSVKDKPSAETKPQTGAFVIAALRISSPALGSGVVPVFAYIVPTSAADRNSLASLVGAVGLSTDNGSRRSPSVASCTLSRTPIAPPPSTLEGI
jgi:hypothetical protein